MGATASHVEASLGCCAPIRKETTSTTLPQGECYATGPGLVAAHALVPASFDIFQSSSDVDTSAFDVDIHAGMVHVRTKSKPVPRVVNRHQVRYVVSTPGTYTVDISRNLLPITGSPFTVFVHPAPDPKETVFRGQGLCVCVAGSKATFDVFPRDAVGQPVDPTKYPLAVTCVSSTGRVIDVSVVPISSGYHVQYRCTSVCTLTITVSILHAVFGDSPYTVPVTPGDIDLASCLISGEGSVGAFCNCKTGFVITAIDKCGNHILAGGEKFHVVVKNSAGAILSTGFVSDKGNGEYHVNYFLSSPTKRPQLICVSREDPISCEFDHGRPFPVVPVPSIMQEFVEAAFTSGANNEDLLSEPEFLLALGVLGVPLSWSEMRACFARESSGQLSRTGFRRVFIKLWPCIDSQPPIPAPLAVQWEEGIEEECKRLFVRFEPSGTGEMAIPNLYSALVEIGIPFSKYCEHSLFRKVNVKQTVLDFAAFEQFYCYVQMHSLRRHKQTSLYKSWTVQDDKTLSLVWLSHRNTNNELDFLGFGGLLEECARFRIPPAHAWLLFKDLAGEASAISYSVFRDFWTRFRVLSSPVS